MATRAGSRSLAAQPDKTGAPNRPLLACIATYTAQYEKAIEVTRQALRLEPERLTRYANVVNYLISAQRFDEARQTAREARERKVDTFVLHSSMYALAFLAGESSAMTEQQQWYADKPETENYGLSLASDTEAFAGHLGRARALTRRAADSASRADSKENGAIWLENAALREAAFGNAMEARQAAAAGLKLAGASQVCGSKPRWPTRYRRHRAPRVMGARPQPT
jgi:tetratricopeptide (TPR) repeat protein